MRFSTAVTALAAALTPVGAMSIFGDDGSPVVFNDDLKVPGSSPLELCDKDHGDDIIEIEHVDLIPNPPEAGKQLQIQAVGNVKETIEEGAYIHLQVKYGLIRLISTTVDLCEQIKNVDIECPIDEGKVTIEKEVDLPKEIPPGRYTVFADAYSKDDAPITCLTATVVFSRHNDASSSSEELDIEM